MLLQNSSKHTTKFDNDCVVYLSEEYLEKDTIAQIKNMCCHPSVKKARIMPDCHSGNGCCVGFTCHITEFISPHLIGGDIGCGVSAYPLPHEFTNKKKSMDKINKIINEIVPMGNEINHTPIITLDQYDHFFDLSQKAAEQFSIKYKEKFGKDIKFPIYNIEWLKKSVKQSD
jgi:RNA-splicing ligase RtcB